MVNYGDKDAGYIAGSLLALAFGFALMMLAVLGLADTIWQIGSPSLYLFVFLAGFGLPLSFGGMRVFLRILRKVDTDLLERKSKIEAGQMPANPAPIILQMPTHTVITDKGKPAESAFQLPDKGITDRWVRWQAFGEMVYRWLAHTGGAIDSAALAHGPGAAFGTSRSRWKVGTDGLAKAGLAEPKVNGQTTRLAISRHAFRMLLDAGKLEWPTDYDPPRIAPPPPPNATIGQTLEAQVSDQ